MPGSQGPFGWKLVANFVSTRCFGKHPATGRLFGFYLRRRPGHIVEIAEVIIMVPGIANSMVATRLLRVGTPALRVVLCLLLVGNATQGKETKADDIAVPEFSVPGGVYTNDLRVVIKSTGIVRFSLDGSEPGPESPAYKGPLQITNCTVVRAKAWTADGRASRTVTQSYTILAEDLLGFSSNLPLVIVKSCNGEIAPAEK